MGICTDGGMVVGAKVSEMTIDIPQDYEWGKREWLEGQGLDVMSPWYDASLEECTVGFRVKEVIVFDIEEGSWLVDLEEKAKKFQELFKVNPRLIGMQDVR